MDSNKPLDQGLIFRTWLPLAASWILMGAELPLLIDDDALDEGLKSLIYLTLDYPEIQKN